jgi:hypothetical protein
MDAWVPYAAALLTIAGTFVGLFITIGKVWRQAEDAAVTVAAVAGKLELTRSELGEHKVEVARNYVTNHDLKNAIEAFTKSVDRLDSRLESYVNAMNRQ